MDHGEFRLVTGRPGVVIGVPHGGFEEFTALMGKRLARLTGAGAVIATGFAGSRTGGIRLNVNRPTEGAHLAPSAEAVTPRAVRVHDIYVALVRRVARGPLALYVEIHGHRRPGCAERVEVATAGVDAPLARRLKARFRAARDRRLDGWPGLPALELAIEPVDPIHFRASAARRWPPFREAASVLHVELPPAARVNSAARRVYVGLLVEILKGMGLRDG